jgi:hypothetical protein
MLRQRPEPVAQLDRRIFDRIKQMSARRDPM